MAVIGKIRKQSGLLVIIIGVALAAFILGDFTKRNRQNPVHIGVVDGEEVSIQDFNKLFDENVEGTKRQKQSDALTQDDLFRVRDNTWNQILEKYLMGKEYEELGLIVTSEELFDQIQGANPHQAVIQNFTNPETGVYDRNLVLNYLQQLDQLPQAQRDQWLTFERYVKDDRLRTKYQSLVSKSYHLPQALAKMAYHDKNDKANVKLVGVKYSTIADSLVKLTDDDYKEYYEKNKKSYDREALRDIDYVVFEIKPSAADSKEAEDYVKDMVNEFTVTPNVAAFVNANSDNRYDSTWLGQKDVPVAIESLMFNNEKGFVYGPYFDNGSYKLVRLADVAMRPDSLKATHILISYKGTARSQQTRTKEAAQRLADSLLGQVKRSASKFTELAQAFSDDPSAKQNKGDLGWFKDGQMVPQFNQFVLSNAVGTIGVVETSFGYHVIEVTGKKEPVKKVRLATITRLVTPSTQTAQDIFAQASRFATSSSSRAEFDKSIEKEGVTKKVAPNLKSSTNKIAGIENPRQIIRWAFSKETEVGDVSTIFDLDNMYVLAVLTKSSDKGIAPWQDVKDVIRTQVMNVKKGEMLVDQMKAYATDMNAMASQFKTTAQDINVSFDSRVLQGFGQESKVIGEIFALSNGQEAGPIAGTGAAYHIQLKDIVLAADRDTYDQIAGEKATAISQAVTNNAVVKAIEKATEVVDNRILFY
jgi:peptidyl-prolyl cis-trans isomerase D